jgi:ESS family glutamate:Na+ symporter
LEIDSIQTLAAAIFVLFLGTFVIARSRILRENDLPVPVVGGILFAIATSLLYAQAEVQLSFDMALKGPMMLTFFTTIGLGANLRMLARGGPQLLLFAVVCAGFLVVQNGLGVLTAVSLDLHPLVGMLAGSIALSGGHGTGAAFASRFSDVQNLAGAMELAMACATFGLIIGGLIGGPVAGRLIARNRLQATDGAAAVGSDAGGEEHNAPEEPIGAQSLLATTFVVLVCLVGGGAIATSLADAAFTLPPFIWSLFLGVVIRNVGEFSGRFALHRPTVDMLGTLSLALFLAMALMSLRLWELVSLAGPLLVLLTVQTPGIGVFAYVVTFRAMGGSYDAAIIAGGHCGFGLGATPTAVANMEALTTSHGPSPQAFLVVPLMGAFFIDLLNALVIQGYLSLPLFGV